MKKIFKMNDLDCAHCADRMEQAIAKIDGVSSVSVNFMAQKMIIDADDARFDEIIRQAQKEVKKVDSNCEIVL